MNEYAISFAQSAGAVTGVLLPVFVALLLWRITGALLEVWAETARYRANHAKHELLRAEARGPFKGVDIERAPNHRFMTIHLTRDDESVLHIHKALPDDLWWGVKR